MTVESPVVRCDLLRYSV